MSLNRYIDTLGEAIETKNGYEVASFLSIRHNHAQSSMIHSPSVESSIRKAFESPWDEVVFEHIKCSQEVFKNDFPKAFSHQYALIQIFTKIFQSQKDENWALPIMYSLCLDLRYIASEADIMLDNKEKPHDLLEKGADLLMGFFRICVGDNRSSQNDTKRWGILNLTTQLFKIYFKVNKLHLLKPLIRVIDSSNLKDQYPLAERVTYNYFVGQQQMFQNKYKLADENLTFAFGHCHRNSKRNKRLILIFLITVKMLLGTMPKIRLLQKYDLMQFAEVAQAVQEGDLQRLGVALSQNEDFFVKWGIRIVLEKLRMIVYRNLFKKVYLILNTHIISIEAFRDALNFKKEYEDDEPIESLEVMCILSNLIYENKIKGYISHQHQKVVLSKQNAFPSLTGSD